MKTRIGTLGPEIHGRFKLANIKMRALELNPTVYSQQETEDIVRRHRELWNEVCDEFDVDPMQSAEVDSWSGVVFYTTESE